MTEMWPTMRDGPTSPVGTSWSSPGDLGTPFWAEPDDESGWPSLGPGADVQGSGEARAWAGLMRLGQGGREPAWQSPTPRMEERRMQRTGGAATSQASQPHQPRDVRKLRPHGAAAGQGGLGPAKTDAHRETMCRGSWVTVGRGHEMQALKGRCARSDGHRPLGGDTRRTVRRLRQGDGGRSAHTHTVSAAGTFSEWPQWGHSSYCCFRGGAPLQGATCSPEEASLGPWGL